MEETKKKVTKLKPIERVTINESNKEKLERLTEHANEALQGISKVCKSDLVNLLLESHNEKLSDEEIGKLKSTHIDQVKLALWLASEVRDAKKSGTFVSLKELLKRCEDVTSVKPSRKKREKKQSQEPIASAES